MSFVPEDFHPEKRERRVENKKSYRASCTIDHKSVFKVTWDWFILALVIYTSIEIPFATAFLGNRDNGHPKSIWEKLYSRDPHEIVNVIVDVTFIIDIIINFRTTFMDSSSEAIVSEPKRIAINYLKTWFVVDFVAAIPFDFFIMGGQGAGQASAASLAGLLKTARLLRLIRVSRKMDRYSEFGFAVIFLLTAFFALIAHWLACIWNVIGEKEIKVPYGWIQQLAKNTGKPVNDSLPGVGSRYITALYFTITSLTSIGFGNVAPNTENEKIFAVLMMLVGALFYAVIFGNLTAIIQRLYSRTNRYHQDVRVVNECIAVHGIPESLQTTLREYFTTEQAATRGDEIESIMYRFPDSLQAEIRVHMSHRLFENFDIFHGLSDACLRALAGVFRVKFFPRQVHLLREGDQVTKLYFIVSGSVEVMQGTQCTMCLGPGDIAGFNVMARGRGRGHCLKSYVSLVAKVRTEAYVITWRDLVQIVRVYPEIKERLVVDQMNLSCNLVSSGTEDNETRTKNPEKDRTDGQHTDPLVVHAKPSRMRKSETCEEGVEQEENSCIEDETEGDLITVNNTHLEKLEAKLSRMEETLDEILMFLENNDRFASSSQLSQSHLFSKTSVV